MAFYCFCVTFSSIFTNYSLDSIVIHYIHSINIKFFKRKLMILIN
jgi:hypothetical protein